MLLLHCHYLAMHCLMPTVTRELFQSVLKEEHMGL